MVLAICGYCIKKVSKYSAEQEALQSQTDLATQKQRRYERLAATSQLSLW